MPHDLVVLASQFNCVLLDDKPGWQHTMGVRSESSDRLYRVAQRRTDGVWGCNCPAWISAKGSPKPPCKHLRPMLPALNRIFPASPPTVRRIGR